MNLSNLYAKTKKAVGQFNMIEKGDKVAIGISGGKDSLTLLYALHGLTKFKDADFKIHGVLIDMGFEGFDPSPVAELCEKLNVPFTHVKTKLKNVIFEERKEKNPCALCSKMRKGILNRIINELGCNKLAYGHHRDDFLNTYLLSLFYEGRFHTMEPKYYMSKSDLTLIRPLLYVTEEEIKGFQRDMNLPVLANPCPMDETSARADMDRLLTTIQLTVHDCREKLFKALKDNNFLEK